MIEVVLVQGCGEGSSSSDAGTPPSLMSSWSLGTVAGPCDGAQLRDHRELRRVRNHRAVWRAAVGKEGSPPPILYVTERHRRTPRLPPYAVDWLLDGTYDVVVSRTTAYAVRRTVLPLLLELTDPIEMNLEATWTVLDDLRRLRVHWVGSPGPRDGSAALSGSEQQPILSLLRRNVKVIMPDTSPATALIGVATTLGLLAWLLVRAAH